MNMANQYSVEQIRDLKNKLSEFKTREISNDELLEILTNIGWNTSKLEDRPLIEEDIKKVTTFEQVLKWIFEPHDELFNSNVEMASLSSVDIKDDISNEVRLIEKQELLDAFGMFDVDNSGTISCDMLQYILTKFGDKIDLNEAETVINIARLVSNGNGIMTHKNLVDLLLD